MFEAEYIPYLKAYIQAKRHLRRAFAAVMDFEAPAYGNPSAMVVGHNLIVAIQEYNRTKAQYIAIGGEPQEELDLTIITTTRIR